MTDNTERELFEAWALAEGYSIARLSLTGHYEDYEVQDAWEVWQARAALSAAPDTEQNRLDAERYRAIRLRHGFILCVRCIDPDNSTFSSETSRTLIDNWADAAVKQVSDWSAKTQQEKDEWMLAARDAEQDRLDAERYQKIVNYPNFLDDLFDCCCEKTDYDKLLDSMPAIAKATEGK